LPDHQNNAENAKVAASEAQRLAVEQIDALFGFVTLGVWAAALTAVFLTLILFYLSVVEARTGVAWTSYIIACAASHTALGVAYRRSQPVGERWRFWAFWFTVISFAEGCGWGWAPVGLTTGGRLAGRFIKACPQAIEAAAELRRGQDCLARIGLAVTMREYRHAGRGKCVTEFRSLLEKRIEGAIEQTLVAVGQPVVGSPTPPKDAAAPVLPATSALRLNTGQQADICLFNNVREFQALEKTFHRLDSHAVKRKGVSSEIT
jgi:hypothetical protein